MEQQKQSKDKKQYVVGLVFIIFIAVMCLLFLFLPKKTYAENEKRFLSAFPTFTAKTLFDGSFGTEYETYISDHIAGRDFFVGLNAYYNLYSGRNGASGIYAGKNNYLINDPIEESDVNLSSNIKRFAEFAKKTEAEATLLIVPSAGYILDNQLPLLHKRYNDDKYFSEIEQEKGALSLVDIRQAFKSSNEQLYFKTDHHWTPNAAFIAYQNFCRSKGISPTPKESFEIESYSGFYGTTYSTSALWFTPSEKIEVWKNKNLTESNITVEIIEGQDSSTYSSLFFYDHLKENDKYPVYLDGNHSLVKISNKNAAGGKLLLVKDSFAHCFATLLAEHYSEIIMVDLRYYKAPISELMKAENANEVLFLYGLDNLAADRDISFLA